MRFECMGNHADSIHVYEENAHELLMRRHQFLPVRSLVYLGSRYTLSKMLAYIVIFINTITMCELLNSLVTIVSGGRGSCHIIIWKRSKKFMHMHIKLITQPPTLLDCRGQVFLQQENISPVAGDGKIAV